MSSGKRLFSFFISLTILFSLMSCQRPMGLHDEPEFTPQCLAMQPGTSQSTQTQFGMLRASYTLSQSLNPDGSLQYTAEVPVRFVPLQGLTQANGLAQHILESAQACLIEAAPYLMGPGGSSLQIILKDVSHLGGTGKDILVTNRALADGEGHSRFWTSQWKCPQKVHEILHLVGLVDGYRDTRNNCRAPAPLAAIMVNPDAAYARAGVGMAAPRESLLFEAEFNAIVAPHCGVSEKYAQCSANAYRNSEAQGCQQIPRDCYQNPESWYLTPPRS